MCPQHPTRKKKKSKVVKNQKTLLSWERFHYGINQKWSEMKTFHRLRVFHELLLLQGRQEEMHLSSKYVNEEVERWRSSPNVLRSELRLKRVKSDKWWRSREVELWLLVWTFTIKSLWGICVATERSSSDGASILKIKTATSARISCFPLLA